MCAESAQRKQESDALFEARNCIEESEDRDLTLKQGYRERLVQLAQARALVSIAASLEKLTALEVIDRATGGGCQHPAWESNTNIIDGSPTETQRCVACGFVRVIR